MRVKGLVEKMAVDGESLLPNFVAVYGAIFRAQGELRRVTNKWQRQAMISPNSMHLRAINDSCGRMLAAASRACLVIGQSADIPIPKKLIPESQRSAFPGRLTDSEYYGYSGKVVD
jgi:hypothetical protein